MAKDMALQVQTACRSDWPQVLPLVCHHLPPERRTAAACEIAAQLERGELSADSLRIVRGSDGIRGAMLHLCLPGHSAVVWPPWAAAGPDRQAVEDLLVQDALRLLRARGVTVCAAELACETFATFSSPLLRQGFRRVTRLRELALDLHFGLPAGLNVHPPTDLQFLPYCEADRGQFLATLEQTYQDSLDFPEVNEVRTAQDALEGYRNYGRADPRLWWLACQGGRPVGVVIVDLTRKPEGNLLYLGVVPSARGQGLGRVLLAHAARQSLAAGASSLSLAVDARNAPALRLYQRAGFRGEVQWEVLLAILRAEG